MQESLKKPAVDGAVDMHIIGEEDDNTNINTAAHGLSGHTPQDSQVQDSGASVAVPGSSTAANAQSKAVGIFGVNGAAGPGATLQPGASPKYLGLAPSASRTLDAGGGLGASPTNTQSKFSLNTLNMLNSRRAGNGPSIAEADEAVAARSLRIIEDQIDFENRYESFKGKLSTEKYKEGIFGGRQETKLPNLILRNIDGNLSPNLSKMRVDDASASVLAQTR